MSRTGDQTLSPSASRAHKIARETIDAAAIPVGGLKLQPVRSQGRQGAPLRFTLNAKHFINRLRNRDTDLSRLTHGEADFCHLSQRGTLFRARAPLQNEAQNKRISHTQKTNTSWLKEQHTQSKGPNKIRTPSQHLRLSRRKDNGTPSKLKELRRYGANLQHIGRRIHLKMQPLHHPTFKMQLPHHLALSEEAAGKTSATRQKP